MGRNAPSPFFCLQEHGIYDSLCVWIERYVYNSIRPQSRHTASRQRLSNTPPALIPLLKWDLPPIAATESSCTNGRTIRFVPSILIFLLNWCVRLVSKPRKPSNRP